MPPAEKETSTPELGCRRGLWRWAVWFAVLVGAGQALFATVSRRAGHLIVISKEVVWMAPVANAVVFGLAAIGVLFVARRLDRKIADRIALAVFVFLSLLGPALMVRRIAPLAAIIFSAGVAVQVGRMLRERVDRLDAFIGRTVPWLIFFCVALAFGQPLALNVLERRAEAALPSIRRSAPNVILIVLDTVRAQNLSLYGYARPTSPQLDEFAKNGVVFERALSTAPWTLPSHASFFTGRLPHDLSSDWTTPLDATHRTLAEEFASQGYVTAGFVGNLPYANAATGLGRGFIHYADFPITTEMLVQDSWLARGLTQTLHQVTGATEQGLRKGAPYVTAEFLRWIEAHPDKPFFAFLNYFDAHAPYLAAPPFEKMFGSGLPPQNLRDRSKWSAQDIQWLIDQYDGTLAYLDEQVGVLLKELKARHLLDNTIVVITSDHGEEFGEHRLFEHGHSLYRPLLHVPLVVCFPPIVPRGGRISEPVSLLDLPATILALAGVTDTTLPGRSLAQLWNPRPQDEPVPSFPVFAEVSKGINLPGWFPVSKGPMQSVVVDGMHYIRSGDGSEELYDFDRDVAEAENLASRPTARAALDKARSVLDELLSKR